ncbi:hypothetical protein [Nonomuraea basaltis]|uniref:hypothetical protein n=1 Tax=Nonomuraea basaltis TaxID=2495887 RepID=UPI00110C62D5|nr:hypothetical protein [Nonomuraea basaltis]TMR88802.1 hypothetical protein EJK15_64240 [Nonomuraea basaltis]
MGDKNLVYSLINRLRDDIIRREETRMRYPSRTTILGTAFFATVALWPVEAQASASPVSVMRTTSTAIAPPDDDRAPYQKGYATGLSEGYQEGEARAREHCEDIPAWPNWPPGAYGKGYADGYMLGWQRGLDDGMAKYCRPS